MASVQGGLIFVDSTGGAAHVGFSTNGTLNNNGSLGSFNIEIFTTDSIGGAQPTLDTGYNAAIIAPGAFANAGGFVDANAVQLFTGDYEVVDQAAGTSPSMFIIGGSGNQTLVGAAGDTLVGGGGNQVLDGLAVDTTRGSEHITGGTGSYSVYGGFRDTIAGSSVATSVTSSQIVAGAQDVINLQTAATATVSAGTSTISAGIGDTISSANGNTSVQIVLAGNDFVNLSGNIGPETFIGTFASGDTIGGDTVTAGNGKATIFGGIGDSLVGGGGPGGTYIDATAGGMNVVVGAGGADSIFAGTKVTVSGGGASAAINLGAADLVNLFAQTGNVTIGALDTTAGNDFIQLGSGAATVFGATGDTINLGTGAQYVDGTLGNTTGGGMNIGIGGTGGSDTIFGSTVLGAADTISGGSATALLANLGTGDVVNLKGTTGIVTVQAGAKDRIVLGDGAATVFGAFGDTVDMGTVGQYVDGTAGGMTFVLGSAGTDSIFGASSTTKGGDLINGGGGAANLDYNIGIGGAGDTINLSASSGQATINAFSNGTAQTKGFNDSIIAGAGNDSVWAGGGDTIGLAASSSVGGNINLWGHSGATTGSVQFGTFNTDTTGSSAAKVTIGGPSASGIGDFVPNVDRLFYPGDNAITDAAIVLAAKNVPGGAQLTLPDGSTMTLVGMTTTKLTALNTAGHLFTA